MFKNIAFLLFFVSQFIYSQETIKGTVKDENNQPLLGANVFWFNTAIGTTTDENGNFSIKKSPETIFLVVSYIGFETKKIEVTSNTISVVLKEVNTLKEVVVSKTKKGTEHSLYKVQNIQVMGQKELLKAACCNLSESFSTNPSIDVNFSDAVTGNRQIKMLGLTSPYILIAEENIPAVRGARHSVSLLAAALHFGPRTCRIGAADSCRFRLRAGDRRSTGAVYPNQSSAMVGNAK